MHSQGRRGGEKTIRLRLAEFDDHCTSLGLDTDTARANAIGVKHSTVGRIWVGEIAPGERFIAGVLAAFPDKKFEDLFEVVDPDSEPVRRSA